MGANFKIFKVYICMYILLVFRRLISRFYNEKFRYMKFSKLDTLKPKSLKFSLQNNS